MRDRGKRQKRAPFNDLLLPILCVLCVMPFCIHLAEYDYGYSSYPWHSDSSVTQDLYAYYRSYFFVVVAIISAFVLAFRMYLYREQNKRSRIFLPLAVYGLFVVFSTIFSINQRASLTGNFYQFQSVFVLLGYALMSFYTYQVMEKEQDYRTVVGGISVAFVVISITGWFQVFRHDLLNYEWVQRLVMSKEQFAEYGGEIADVFSGNNVFLTLFNPNYAAVFLVMFASVFAALAFFEQEKKRKIGFLVLFFSSLVLLWFTYTRASLVALVIGAFLFVLCTGGRLRKSLKYILPGLLVVIVALVGIDAANGFHYFSRMVETGKDSKLEDMRTLQDGILISYDGMALVLSMEDGGLSVADESGEKVSVEKKENGEMLLPFSEPVPAMLMEGEEETSLLLEIEEYTFEFVRNEEGYFFRNEEGKLDLMAEIPHVDMHGLEYLGSGRLYIWSRVLPLLKSYLLVGSGPDTFAEVYPQNDYVGKMIYAESTRRIMENAHNEYLGRWVQTGLTSLVAMLVFYVMFIRRCFSHYRNCPCDTRKNQLGFGCFVGCCCYLICGFFTDSSLYATPVFFVFAGIALSAANSSDSGVK